MQEFKVALIQAKTEWHKPDSNFKNCEQLIANSPAADLLLLPEMWSTGYTMKAPNYAESSLTAVNLMIEWAKGKGAHIAGSLIVKEGGFFYNRLYVVNGEGVQYTYDKKHLFAFAGEDRIYKAGKQQLTFTISDWKFCANICYDLRFPVWARNVMDYDVLFYVANWPDKRLTAWDTLLRARAIENQSYVLGVNCFGQDVWGNKYKGHSTILDCMGEAQNAVLESEGVIVATLTKEHISSVRKTLPFLKDKDNFELN